MSEEIQVGDMTYVSSRRASDISGYAQDYIGQLARNSLIDAKRIGGLWYVDMKSLESYKAKPQSMPQEEKDSTISSEKKEDSLVSFDGKDYISANRASKITGYNQDYVGQLARSGKILSRQVGNRWFVDREAILAHKSEKDSLLASVQAESVGVYREVQKSEEEVQIHKNIPEPQLLNYISEEGHLIPHIEGRSNWQGVALSRAPRNISADTAWNSSEDGAEDENPVPIHVIRKPSFNQKVRPAYAFKPKKDVRSSYKTKIPLPVGILILSIILLGSLGGVLFVSGSTTTSAVQGGLGMTANALTSITGSAFNGIASFFEGIIDPGVNYQRSN